MGLCSPAFRFDGVLTGLKSCFIIVTVQNQCVCVRCVGMRNKGSPKRCMFYGSFSQVSFSVPVFDIYVEAEASTCMSTSEHQFSTGTPYGRRAKNSKKKRKSRSCKADIKMVTSKPRYILSIR